jgi:hypothetical protein
MIYSPESGGLKTGGIVPINAKMPIYRAKNGDFRAFSSFMHQNSAFI